MSHVRAIQWLCDNADDDDDDECDNDDNDDAAELSPAPVVSSLPSSSVDENSPVVLVCMCFAVILILIMLFEKVSHFVHNCAA